MSKAKDVLLVVVALTVLFGLIYAIRVAPYDNDIKCLIAECRINK